MMNEQTISKLNTMRLFGMARGLADRIGSAQNAGLSHEEFVGLLVDDEKIHRDNARLGRLLSKARLKQASALEDVDYRAPRGLDKQVLVELSAGHWIDRHQSVLITGPTGVGKSFLACALGNQACRSGNVTTYYRFSRLLESLQAARGDGSHLKVMTRLSKTALLILDDFGLTQLSALEAKDLLELLEDRYGSASTIITSQLPTRQWHEIIGEPTIADAICDRLFHNCIQSRTQRRVHEKENRK